jgi:glycosyltransferase involved in cell wall biosynthesis
MSKLSIIVTSYNRPHYLIRTIEALRRNVAIDFELIINDDCSSIETISAIRKINPDIAIFNSQKLGFGASLNRACKIASGDYHLILQDDFAANYNLNKYINTAIEILERGDVDIFRLGSANDFIRFYPNMPGSMVDYWKNVNQSVFNYNGMQIKTVIAGHETVWVYTDNPHIRKKDFLSRFGNYLENETMVKTEIDMKKRFNMMNGKSSWFLSFENNPPFDHIGIESTH